MSDDGAEVNVDPDHAMQALDFIVERHRVWQARQNGAPQPWTDDPTLATRKFTNVYRVLDPGSQFVLTDLAPRAAARADVFARLFLYRYTNWPDTWRYLRDKFGGLPGAADFEKNTDVIIRIIQNYRDNGGQVFSGAYMIIPQPGKPGDKVEMVVELTARAVSLWPTFNAAGSQKERIDVLKSLYGVGDFLAQQILTDWNYTSQSGSHPDIENEYVVKGPGSKRGAKYVAPGLSTVDAIVWLRNALLADPRCPSLEGRPPSLMDVQNCFCEYSKYVKGPRANAYRPAHPGPQPAPVLPAYWRH